MCPDDLYHLRGSPQNMGHNWGTSRGDSLVANRRQNKGLWCSAVQLTAECSTIELAGNRATPLLSLYYRKRIRAMTLRNHR
jgi:hypothetical protein